MITFVGATWAPGVAFAALLGYARDPALGHFRDRAMSTAYFLAAAVAVVALGAIAPHVVGNGYVFYAGFIALQYVVIATAWNILGGYAGFVNFGSGAFVGVGVYAAVFLFKAWGAPLWAQLPGAAFAAVCWASAWDI